MSRVWSKFAPVLSGACLLGVVAPAFCADEQPVIHEQLKELKRQNEALQQQLQNQQKLIDGLTQKVTDVQNNAARENDQAGEPPAMPSRGFSPLQLGKVHLSGEGGAAFFHSGSHGPFPNSEFRIDEAKLFIEASLWKDVYFFSEVNITTRESMDEFMQIGELYVDFENLSRFWNRDGWLNLRVGRMDIPFGEEYLTRDAIDNPLISHSLTDIWGVDEGLEIYGSIAKFQYALAVQNGGHPALRDFDPDKSIALRIGYDPTKRVHLSLNAMRTGALAVNGDTFSELWFGNAFIRSLDNANATTFQANLLEADAQVRWSKGYLKGAGGYVKYNDNGSADLQREIYYYYFEGRHHFLPKFYAAGRWSQMFAPNGFPLVGNGTWNEYFFSPTLTERLSRLSLGLGYRFNSNLLLKGEYSFNEGQELGGEKRNHENMVSLEAAFAF